MNSNQNSPQATLPKHLLASALAGALLTVASPSWGAAKGGEFAIKDAGRASCETFAEARKEGGERYGRFAGWTMGYLTAYNQVIPETFDVVPWQDLELLMALMQNFCEKNADTSYITAVTGLLSVLKTQRLSEKSELLTISNDVQIYKEIMKRLQQRLKDLGHYRSTVDGLYGPGTRKAIIAFQKSISIPTTGLPDQTTLYQALMPRPES